MGFTTLRHWRDRADYLQSSTEPKSGLGQSRGRVMPEQNRAEKGLTHGLIGQGSSYGCDRGKACRAGQPFVSIGQSNRVD